MEYRLAISEKARAQLRSLPREQRRQIGLRIEALQHDLQGDIRNLKGCRSRYRLRVGSVRVLFVLENDLVAIYGVCDRKDAYE